MKITWKRKEQHDLEDRTPRAFGRRGASGRTLLSAIVLILLAPATAVRAQENPPAAAKSPLIAHSEGVWGGVKAILLASAEKMPEESYGFKPAESVRSYGQIVGHVADSQYFFCSAVRGEKNPMPNVEKTISSKAGLVAALREAFAYCDQAWGTMTDSSAEEIINFMGGDNPRFGALTVNNVHTIEHYGNLVTYLRMNDLVPPTSDQEFMKEMRKR